VEYGSVQYTATASGGHRYIEVYWRYFESAKKTLKALILKH
jgi:hypothetical protein